MFLKKNIFPGIIIARSTFLCKCFRFDSHLRNPPRRSSRIVFCPACRSGLLEKKMLHQMQIKLHQSPRKMKKKWDLETGHRSHLPASEITHKHQLWLKHFDRLIWQILFTGIFMKPYLSDQHFDENHQDGDYCCNHCHDCCLPVKWYVYFCYENLHQHFIYLKGHRKYCSVRRRNVETVVVGLSDRLCDYRKVESVIMWKDEWQHNIVEKMREQWENLQGKFVTWRCSELGSGEGSKKMVGEARCRTISG